MEIPYTTILLIGAVTGFVFGLIPLILGFMKSRLQIGLIGFGVSIVAGLIGNLLFALPASLIFTWYFFFRKTSD